jgi:hypothetical protein
LFITRVNLKGSSKYTIDIVKASQTNANSKSMLTWIGKMGLNLKPLEIDKGPQDMVKTHHIQNTLTQYFGFTH